MDFDLRESVASLRWGAALTGRAVFVVALSRSSVYDSIIRTQVPNPMLVPVTEGALIAFTHNGDEDELIA